VKNQFKPTLAQHPADILSNLVLLLKTGYAGEYPYPVSPQTTSIDMAFHYLGVSARHFRESLIWLRMAAGWFGYSIKILSIFVLDNSVNVFLRFGNHEGKLRVL
jgi:hypothetical protein